MTRHCVHCGGEIPDSKRWGAQYCSRQCSTRAYQDALYTSIRLVKGADPEDPRDCQRAISRAHELLGGTR